MKSTPLLPVAIIPAAGHATRLGRLPCSKEVLPVYAGSAKSGDVPGIKPAAAHLLEYLAAAGVRQAYFVVRSGKWDIPACFLDVHPGGLRLAYVVVEHTDSVVDSIRAALPFTAHSPVVLGFPDIVMEPADALHHLRNRFHADIDVLLALFPAGDPAGCDTVDIDSTGRVRRIAVKNHSSKLRYTWTLAMWGPRFSAFLETCAPRKCHSPGEFQPGDVIQAAIETGMCVEAITFPQGRYLDIGTPEGLALALRGELWR